MVLEIPMNRIPTPRFIVQGVLLVLAAMILILAFVLAGSRS